MTTEILNESYASPGPYPPAFENIAEGLAHLDEVEQAKIKELQEAAAEAMRLDQEDPTKQEYFVRLDRNTVVKTAEEYTACQLNNVSLKRVPYSAAVHVLKQEEARKRQHKKTQAKKKAAKKARKRNR